jgi:hypothetical protein
MIKTFTFSFVFSIFFSFVSVAQQSHIELISSDEKESVIKVTISGCDFKDVNTNLGFAQTVLIENGTPILKQGAPDLPKLTTSLIIPDNDGMEVLSNVISFTEYNNIEIAPSKGNQYRNINLNDVSYQKGNEYSENKFFPALTSELRTPYILRDYRGITVVINPVQYNPISKTLRLNTELIITVRSISDVSAVNPILKNRNLEKVQSEYQKIYSSHFLNYRSITGRYNALNEEGNMLIIAKSNYMNAMLPFIEWKKQRGINVEMVDIASIGNTSTAIKSYITNYYNNNGLTFLLLVGDAQHITPFPSIYGDCDNCYGYVSGSDSYPELFVGRFSAENETEVSTQVNRTLKYEKYPQLGATWYGRGLGIASDQGPGDDNEMDFEHVRNIRTKLLNFGFTNVAEFYDGSQGQQDATGNPNPQMVVSELQNGVGIINYTGHGSTNGCSSSGLSTTEVNALTNTNAFPFFFSVACVNGNFVGGTCFAESWLRATDDITGEPTGAIGTYMATINQSWNPPMCGQDEMNDILTEAHLNNIKRTFAGIGINGCMQMNDEYGAAGDEMTDTWTCFGDPSFMIRTAAPHVMNVTHVSTELIGLTQLSVFCDEEGALITLLLNGDIIGSGTVTGGVAVINFDPVLNPENIEVAATAFNTVPYFGVVEITSLMSIQDKNLIGFNAFPNPVKEQLNVIFALQKNSFVNVEFINLAGQTVMTNSLGVLNAGMQSQSIDLEGLSKGIYFLSLQTNTGITKHKVVVE